MAEEIPCLFSTSNQTIPVLVLHGDKTLHRRRRPRHTSREAATTAAPARPKETKQGGQEREEGGQTSDNYFLYRGGVKGKVSQERWDLAEAAGRLDRLSYWEQCMPAQVQVEKVSKQMPRGVALVSTFLRSQSGLRPPQAQKALSIVVFNVAIVPTDAGGVFSCLYFVLSIDRVISRDLV